MVLAIEPMINMGGSAVKVLEDQWTAVTKDGSLSRLESEVVGWAALMEVSNRAVYVGVAEVSVYVDEDQKSRGSAAHSCRS